MEMTINKLVYLLTTVLLVVLLIWGHTSGWLRPLYEDLEGGIDRVALLIGRFGGGNATTDVGCYIRPVIGEIDGVIGESKACRDKCVFILHEPDELLGYEEFMFTSGGHSALKVGSEKFVNMDAFGNAVDISELHKDAYDRLMEIVNDFYDKSLSKKSKEEFFKPLEFDSSAYFRITVGVDKGTTVYDWDGESWLRTYSSEYDDVSYEVSQEDVLDYVLESYVLGYSVYWNYVGDGKSNIPISDFNEKYREERYSEDQFIGWLGSRRSDINVAINQDKAMFYIEIEDRFINTIYTYANYEINGEWKGEWRKNNFIGLFNEITEDKVLEEIFEAHNKGAEMFWYNDTKIAEYTPVSNHRIISRNEEVAKDRFEKWFKGMEKGFSDNVKNQSELLEDFLDYSEDIQVELRGEMFDVEVDSFEDVDRSRVVIYFETNKTNKNERFGVFFEDGKFVLSFESPKKETEVIDEFGYGGTTATSSPSYYGNYNTPEVEKKSIRSIVGDWVSLEDGDWEDFLKINEINEYLVEKCGE